MANLPASTSRRFNPSDYREAPNWFTGRFLSQLTLFTEPVYQALLNALTFAQNFNSQTYVLTITGDADFTRNVASFQSAIAGNPTGLILVARNVASDLSIPVISPIDYSWYFNAGSIIITGISGLTPGTTYNLTFLVF